ncbi:MAG: hypothetical protein U9N39_03840 [Campylobacterota bacterium]|nr:hypothetical protein [Campylobacterota bacterium]
MELITQGKTDEAIEVLSKKLETATKSKEKSFHYLPYNFKQSGFEKEILEQFFTLNYDDLEIYYNGEKGLTQFVIECYKKQNSNYKYIGKYTTDFLIIKRDERSDISKILILETKGEGFANNFLETKKFMEDDFIKINEEGFGYKKIDFLYLEDSLSLDDNLKIMDKKIKGFFQCQ